MFKKQYNDIMNERREKGDFLMVFYYLLSIMDRKEDKSKHGNNVNISPVDCSISFIESFPKKQEKFYPSLLDSTDRDLKKLQVEMSLTGSV